MEVNNLVERSSDRQKLSDAHTAAHISEVLKESLKEFSIDQSNIMAVVTDNGANIVKAIHDTFGTPHTVLCTYIGLQECS